MTLQTLHSSRQTWKRIGNALVALQVVWFVAKPSQAQDPKTTTRDMVVVTARVDRIDPFSRSLTLRTPEGQMHTAYVGRELKVFDELKAGDTVKVRIAESIIVAMRPNAKLTGPVDTTAAAREESGAHQADVLQQLKAVIRIESVDRATNAVVYMTGDNRRVIRAVADPKLLEGVNPGDVIEITYTRARAIELERQP